MPLQIVRNDITKLHVDAIVNAANSSLLGGGGVDGAIHRAAGPGLYQECRGLNGCETGQAKITGAYHLPCKYVIHTVGPRWLDGCHGERELLESCYRESLLLAETHQCVTVAFPLISAGAYGYPKEEALQVAVNVISDFLLHHDMQVILVVFDKGSFQISKKLIDDITEYVDEHYVETHYESRIRNLLEEERHWDRVPKPVSKPAIMPAASRNETGAVPAGKHGKPGAFGWSGKKQNLEDMIEQIDESFSEMLLRKIDEKGMTDAECYKKANIDRKLFSKIRSNVNYKPSKTTAIAFAIALELSLDETKDMLMKAGFALSHSNKFDIIIEYFIKNENYNIFEINEALFAFDQSLLGA